MSPLGGIASLAFHRANWRDPEAAWESVAQAVVAEVARVQAIPHNYDGLCPDNYAPDSRDPECQACCEMVRLGIPLVGA